MNEEPTHISRIVDEKIDTLIKNQSIVTNVITDDEVKTVSLEKKPRGGARPGSGRPKGSMSPAKRTALEAKNRFIERVHGHVDELFDAQLQLAKGENVVMVKIKERDEKGNVKKIYHEIVTDPETIKQVIDNEYGTSDVYDDDLNDQDHYHYVMTKPANNQAIEGMLNRAYGKAPEKVEIEGGFFKVDNLTINVREPLANPEKTEDDVIDIETEE